MFSPAVVVIKRPMSIYFYIYKLSVFYHCYFFDSTIKTDIILSHKKQK